MRAFWGDQQWNLCAASFVKAHWLLHLKPWLLTWAAVKWSSERNSNSTTTMEDTEHAEQEWVGSALLSLGIFSKDHPLRWRRTDSTPEEKSSVCPTYVVFLLDGARGSELPSDSHSKYLVLVDSSGPVQWTKWCWATWTMPVTWTQDDLNSAAVFPLVFQTPKLEGMGEKKKKEKAKTKYAYNSTGSTEITTKNTEHSLLGIAALICTNKKI